jgi:hypothetical protein
MGRLDGRSTLRSPAAYFGSAEYTLGFDGGIARNVHCFLPHCEHRILFSTSIKRESSRTGAPWARIVTTERVSVHPVSKVMEHCIRPVDTGAAYAGSPRGV